MHENGPPGRQTNKERGPGQVKLRSLVSLAWDTATWHPGYKPDKARRLDDGASEHLGKGGCSAQALIPLALSLASDQADYCTMLHHVKTCCKQATHTHTHKLWLIWPSHLQHMGNPGGSTMAGLLEMRLVKRLVMVFHHILRLSFLPGPTPPPPKEKKRGERHRPHFGWKQLELLMPTLCWIGVGGGVGWGVGEGRGWGGRRGPKFGTSLDNAQCECM